jgi:hypothetical protein
MPTMSGDQLGPEPAPPFSANDYDSLAEAYTAENDAGITNAYCERG